MKKIIIYLILFFQLLSGPTYGLEIYGVADPSEVYGVAEPAKVFGVTTDYCNTETYAPSLTADINYAIGYTNRYWTGCDYAPSGNQTVCKIDVYVDVISGTLSSSHDYYLAIYSKTGNDLNAELGRSNKIDGDTLSAATWTSANAGYWVFSSHVSLTNGTTYAFVWFLDTDGDPDDQPEVDGTNFPRIGVDDENNGDAILLGVRYYAADKGSSSWDEQDDMLIKVYTP